MRFKDYYKILGVDRKANILEIKKSYRQIAFKYHPDKNKDTKAQKSFIEITEAYEVLKDPSKREIYDQSRNLSSEQKEENPFNRQQKQWTENGYEKAKEYSNMEFDIFLKKILGEVKAVTNNSLSIIMTLFCLLAAFMGIPMISISPVLGIFSILFWGILGFLLFNRTRINYKNDRNKILKK